MKCYLIFVLLLAACGPIDVPRDPCASPGPYYVMRDGKLLECFGTICVTPIPPDAMVEVPDCDCQPLDENHLN